MKQETAQKALIFLQRAQLTGGEVHAFLEVMAALDEIANPPKKIEQMPEASSTE